MRGCVLLRPTWFADADKQKPQQQPAHARRLHADRRFSSDRGKHRPEAVRESAQALMVLMLAQSKSLRF
jgi:hypothetical protein